MRCALNDSEWRTICPILPREPGVVPRVDDRRALNGIFWVLMSGAPWRDPPEHHGPTTTCHNRFVRWRLAGVWQASGTAYLSPSRIGMMPTFN